MSHAFSGRILIEFGDYKKVFANNKVQAQNKIMAGPFSVVCPNAATPFGSPWPQLTNAINSLSSGPQTVNFSYSFIIPGTTMDPGTAVTLEDKSGGPTNAEYKGEIREALEEWQDVFQTIFSRRNGYKNNLTLTFTDLGDETGTGVGSNSSEPSYSLPHPDNIGHFRFGMHDIDGSGDVVAHAYSPETSSSLSNVGGDCHFDSSETWRLDTNSTPGAISIKMVATHEIGHCFGIGHPSNTFSIMYAFVSSTQNFHEKWPRGLINGHTGAGDLALEDACNIEEIYG